MNQDICTLFRAQAWERAKGELQSVLVTFHSTSTDQRAVFEQLNGLVESFIKEVEDNGLAE